LFFACFSLLATQKQKLFKHDSTHACSEIGQKWSKFGFRILDWQPHNKNSEILAIEDDSYSPRRIKTIFSQFRNTHSRYRSYFEQIMPD
jgi:hypothetical protein